MGIILTAGAQYIYETWIIHNTGQIEILAYLAPYTDGTPYVNGTSIEWGTVAPNSLWYINLTVQNISPMPVTVYVANDMSIPSWLNCTWTANGTYLTPNSWAIGNFTLGIDASAPQGGSFDFDALVTADDGA